MLDYPAKICAFARALGSCPTSSAIIRDRLTGRTQPFEGCYRGASPRVRAINGIFISEVENSLAKGCM